MTAVVRQPFRMYLQCYFVSRQPPDSQIPNALASGWPSEVEELIQTVLSWVRNSEAEKVTVSASSLASVCPASVEGWTEGCAENRGRRSADARREIGERKRQRGALGEYPEQDDAKEERTDGVEEAAWRMKGCLVDGTTRPGHADSS
jgi:hypothetical protein